MDVSDEILVELCHGELPYATDAFESLLRRYEPTVYRTCLRYLGNAQDAEEASQDAFLRAFHGLKKFSGDSLFRTWLYRIVANVCATRYQKMKREAERQAAYIEDVVTEARGTYESPQTALELSGPVADALTSLSAEDRQVLILRHVSELTVPEIASIIQTKLSTAKMRLSRAEKRMREQYELLVGKTGDFFPNL